MTSVLVFGKAEVRYILPEGTATGERHARVKEHPSGGNPAVNRLYEPVAGTGRQGRQDQRRLQANPVSLRRLQISPSRSTRIYTRVWPIPW